MNSIKVEPVSFYPNSTEEIMCSNNIISHAHNLTYGILRDRTEEQMKKMELWGEDILSGLFSWIKNQTGTHDYNIFCHIGIRNVSDNGRTSDKDAGGLIAEALSGKSFYFNKSLISLTYKETEEHITPWLSSF